MIIEKEFTKDIYGRDFGHDTLNMDVQIKERSFDTLFKDCTIEIPEKEHIME